MHVGNLIMYRCLPHNHTTHAYAVDYMSVHITHDKINELVIITVHVPMVYLFLSCILNQALLTDLSQFTVFI